MLLSRLACRDRDGFSAQWHWYSAIIAWVIELISKDETTGGKGLVIIDARKKNR